MTLASIKTYFYSALFLLSSYAFEIEAIINSKLLRLLLEKAQGIVIEVEEDLFHNSPGRELLILEVSLKMIPLKENRMFQSLVNEFNGIASSQSETRGDVLASKNLRLNLSNERGNSSMENVNPFLRISIHTM